MKKKKSPSAMYTVPVRIEDLPGEDIALIKACHERSYDALVQALRGGGDMQAYYYDQAEPAHSLSGKQPIHIAAKMGFHKGVELLVQRGVDIDSADRNPRTGNTALGLTTDSNRLMFAQLLALGSDPMVPNHLGYSVNQMVRHADRMARRTKEGMNYGKLLEVFEQLPYRDDFAALKPDDLFTRNEQGLCLMDNPLILRQIDEVVKALAKNGTPLTLAHLERHVPQEAQYLMPEQMEKVVEYVGMGVEAERLGKVVKPVEREVSYLERITQCGRLKAAVAALNNQGQFFQKSALLTTSGKPTPLMALASHSNQVDAFFTHSNWENGDAGSLSLAYQAVPETSRWQIENYQQLSLALRNQERPRHHGR